MRVSGRHPTKFLFKWLFQQNFPSPRASPLLQILFSFAELCYKSTVQFNLMSKLGRIFLNATAVFSDAYQINKCILFVLSELFLYVLLIYQTMLRSFVGITDASPLRFWPPSGTHCTFILNKTKCTDGIVDKCYARAYV